MKNSLLTVFISTLAIIPNAIASAQEVTTENILELIEKQKAAFNEGNSEFKNRGARIIVGPDVTASGAFGTPFIKEAQSEIWLHQWGADPLVNNFNYEEIIGEQAKFPGYEYNLEVKPVINVEKGPSNNQVRFFKEGDERLAIELAKKFEDAGVTVVVNNLSEQYGKYNWINEGHIEVWMGPKLF